MNHRLNINFPQKRNYYITVGVILGLALSYMTSPLLQEYYSQAVDWVMTSQYSRTNSSKSVGNYPLSPLKLHPNDSILVQSMLDDYVNVGVANQGDTSLLSQIASDQSERSRPSDIEEESLPWFYYSPLVSEVSPMSYANQYRLVFKESVNDFAWYQHKGQTYLFQYGKPYTGWHTSPFGYYYYEEGVQQANTLTPQEVYKRKINQQLSLKLTPPARSRFFFIDRPFGYSEFNTVEPVHYSILYKNTESIILSAPPRTSDSQLVSDTADFYEMPMEVREEYHDFDETWLHVYIGYDELGWIRKDSSYNDYVLTFYSEQELLDTIQAIIAEEIEWIAADVGASFVNNETMAQVDVNSHVFFPASTQKIYVLGELYHQYQIGQLDPYDVVTLTDYDKVPGAGVLQGHVHGSQYYIDELVDLVAIYSDNTAANLLIDTVGGSTTINPHVQQLGLYDTALYGKYYYEDSYLTTSPHDAARYFALLYNRRLNGEPYDSMLIDKFYLNSHTFLRTYIWGDTTSYNKSGLGGTEQNDVATFITPYGSYTLAVYTANPYNYDIIGEQLAMLSLRVHDVFNEMRSDLWITVEDPESLIESGE